MDVDVRATARPSEAPFTIRSIHFPIINSIPEHGAVFSDRTLRYIGFFPKVKRKQTLHNHEIPHLIWLANSRSLPARLPALDSEGALLVKLDNFNSGLKIY